MSAVNDDLVAQFMAITGSSDAATATTYVEMSGGNLEMAIGLFMEHGVGGGGGDVGGGGGGSLPGGGGGGGGMDDATALAAAAAMQDDEVRAPDATRTMRLMDEGPSHPMMMMGGMLMGSGGMMDPSLRMMQEMMEEQLQLQRGAFDTAPVGSSRRTRRPGGSARDAIDAAAEAKDNSEDFDDQYNYEVEDEDMEDGDDVDEHAIGGRPSRADHGQSLQDMFAAPTHLMHKAGGFQGARQMAKDTKRWLLVNIQKDDEFSCHALNRDVWRNDLVENLIREGFIFFQERADAVEGSQFVQRYKVQDYPHISIIDPRTGRLVWSKQGWTQQNPLTAEQFAEIVMDFCSRHSLDRPPMAPEVRSKSGGSAAKLSVEAMTEDEQLKAAMEASMEDQKPSAASEKEQQQSLDGVDDGQVLGYSADHVKAAATATRAQPPAPSQFQTWLQTALPPDGGNARIQFRMPDGKRVVRTFDGTTTTVQIIHAFVAQSLSDNDKAAQKEFSLMAGFPPKDLAPMMDKTVDECALKGEAVTVRWK